ncbi:MAG: TlpA family protein disulfide reductase, partial [Verrucomicrobia bacterium]|nr:TlpA family protein disulfide reductase [Prolixibacteraceae bacterium]
FLFLIFVLFCTGSLSAQEVAASSIGKLVPGYPKEIEGIKNQLVLSDLSYVHLETGIDTLSVMFGELTQQGHKGYWITLWINHKLALFTTPSLEKRPDSGLLSNTIDLTFDDSSQKISVQITHDPSTNQIHYLWVNKDQPSKMAVIEKMERPIKKGKMFPPMKVLSLSGDSISIKSFANKYVVINWWATTCGPCRQEIPGLNTLVEKYKANPEVVFLAIAFDKKQALEYYLNLQNYSYIQTMGDGNVARLFGKAFPRNVIINPQGMIAYYSEGGYENIFQDIDNELQRLLKK